LYSEVQYNSTELVACTGVNIAKKLCDIIARTGVNITKQAQIYAEGCKGLHQ
jgi:hypothetical protein